MKVKNRWARRPGRPRVINVERHPSGRAVEPPSAVHRETVEVRARDARLAGLQADQALDPLAGYSLGQMLLRGRMDPGDPGSISQAQFDAGTSWAALVRRHAIIMGYSLGASAGAAGHMVGGNGGSNQEPDEAEIIAVRRRWSDGYRAIMDACRQHGLAVRDAVYAVCVDDAPIVCVTQEQFGLLRIGLNALARAL